MHARESGFNFKKGGKKVSMISVRFSTHFEFHLKFFPLKEKLLKTTKSMRRKTLKDPRSISKQSMSSETPPVIQPAMTSWTEMNISKPDTIYFHPTFLTIPFL